MAAAPAPAPAPAPANRVLVPAEIGGPPLGAFGRDAQLCEIEGPTMGTTWSVRLASPDARAIAHHKAAIEALLAALIDDLSNWEPDSALSHLNRAPIDAWQPLPTSLIDVLAAARAIHDASGGAFDPTVARAVAAWGFGPVGRPPASPESRVSTAAACVVGGFDAIELDVVQGRGRRRADVAVDLCGIAKGYAVDRVSTLLVARGVPHHLVEIGGELRGSGVKPDGMPWWVALERPPGTCDDGPIVAALHGLSIATSGDYRSFVEVDGVRLAHTIDPRTGRPLHDAPAAVTVLHADCMVADAEATAITVLGADAGLAYATARRLAARIVVRTPHAPVRHTPAFDAMLA